MQAFAVVIALLAVAALGWALTMGARYVLRRHGVPTRESDLQGPDEPGEDERARE
jgi:hypothetical protein